VRWNWRGGWKAACAELAEAGGQPPRRYSKTAKEPDENDGTNFVFASAGFSGSFYKQEQFTYV